MLITMSISSAPWRTASRASYAFAVGVTAPSGKPTTAHTITPEPRSWVLQNGTQVVFTHTEAKPYLRASSQSSCTSSRVASGLSSV
jgi:hypothetical protein